MTEPLWLIRDHPGTQQGLAGQEPLLASECLLVRLLPLIRKGMYLPSWKPAEPCVGGKDCETWWQ